MGAQVAIASSAEIDRVGAVVVSPAIVDGLLRTGPGFTGLVLTDDRGGAVAVRSAPTGQRAVRVIRAGATTVLTIQPGDLGLVEDALTATAAFASFFTARCCPRGLGSVDQVLCHSARGPRWTGR